MLKIHDLKQAEILDRNAMLNVQGGVDYKSASKSSGYKEIDAHSQDVLVSKLDPALIYEWWLA